MASGDYFMLGCGLDSENGQLPRVVRARMELVYRGTPPEIGRGPLLWAELHTPKSTR